MQSKEGEIALESEIHLTFRLLQQWQRVLLANNRSNEINKYTHVPKQTYGAHSYWKRAYASLVTSIQSHLIRMLSVRVCVRAYVHRIMAVTYGNVNGITN